MRPETLNPYAYSLNNPLYWSDPSGECPICLLALLLGLTLAGCSVDDTSYDTARNASVGLQVFDYNGDYGWSIATYIGSGRFITHDHFAEPEVGLPQPDVAERVNLTDATGATVATLQQGQLHLVEKNAERYAIYRVDGGAMESAGLKAATLGNGSEVSEGQTVTSVRWQGGLPGGTIEVFSAAVADIPSEIGLGDLVYVAADTTLGDSGAGLWRDSQVVGVLRRGVEGSGRTMYDLYLP